MQGDFSVLNFDPHAHERAASPPSDGVLRNLSGVLHQQGRVVTDADLTEGELLELAWNGQAGRDIIGAGVCAVPAGEPQAFRVEAALAAAGGVQLTLRPGRAWVDGILTRLAGEAPDPLAPVQRLATYLGPPLSEPLPTPAEIGDGTRDAVILEVSEEALHGLQYPQRLIEPALGGPDTSARAFVNFRLRLLRLRPDEDCSSLPARLRDDPAAKGRLTASLAPVIAIAGDCPVVGGGGYSGFEHHLYRIEIADTPAAAPARFKWSQWNGGLVGRGRFDATTDPDRVTIDAGRAAIIDSGLTSFYLEALQYDAALGAWTVVYASGATLNTDHELELAAPAAFGTLPSTTEPVFFRLWNGIADIAAFPPSASPVELRDGIRLAFDAPAAGTYRPGDYWTFTVRAGEIFNPQVLLDHQPPVGIVLHRVALAEIDWTARRNTAISGTIEDCRRRFRPLVNQKTCCTFLVGDGVSSFGDFNALEEAAAHLPAAGGELCLLPGLHRANLRLEGKRHVKIHGCRWRTMVLPRSASRTLPVLHFVDCSGIEVCDLDLLTYDGIGVRIDGSADGSCRDLRIHDTRMIARSNAIRASQAAGLVIAGNRLHLLDTVDGRATISVQADDVLIERNTLLLSPFVDTTPDEPDEPDDDPTRDPADPCARPEILYRFPALLRQYAFAAWGLLAAQLVPLQPYRAIGGIHVRAGSERVRVLENEIVGGAGNGITLGGDLDAQDAPPTAPSAADVPRAAAAGTGAPTAVNVASSGRFLALLQDEQGRPLPDVDLYLEAAQVATDRSDAQGLASIKTAPGAYLLDVAPPYRVLRVTEARDEGVLVNAVTLAAAGRAAARGFLHQIAIEANDIAMMGLSGIGFAARAGRAITGATQPIPANDPKAALLAQIDAALLNLALTPLLRATDRVRELTVLGNRLHHNLRNPFTDALRAEAQFIGRGGISLAVVEAAVIADNHVHENGPRAADPACGIFVGYGDNLAITGNVLAANGEAGAEVERNRGAGIRGGIYVRFAGAVTTQLSGSSGRNAALRVHGNRIDQPIGRALTAFAFGPVSVADNHLNSESSGLSGLLDIAVGGVLLCNLGGIHRLLARRFGAYLAFEPGAAATSKARYGVAAERALPGGETLFDDNYVRLGIAHRSITSQLLLAIDDLGYASNTSAVYGADPFFANAVLVGDSLRATASRLREDALRTISLLSIAMRMNMTALNQGDHCIVARPQAGTTPLPTVSRPNQVLNDEACSRFDDGATLWRFLASVLSAHPGQLGGTLPDDAFTAAQFDTLTQQTTAQALRHANATQVATTQAYQAEAARMADKHGAAHPTAQALQTLGQAGAQASRVMSAGAEAVSVEAPQADEGGSSFSGRFVNDRGQGLADHVVELVQAGGRRVEGIGRTDANGFFGAAFDAARTAALAKEGDLSARVLDLAGQELLLDKTALRFAPGAQLQVTLVVPVRAVPKPTVPPPPPPVPPPPPPPPSPPPAVRTSLAKLDIDDDTRKLLQQGGVPDVEALLEIDPAKLAKIVNSEETARKLIELARRLLGTPTPKPQKRTSPPKKAR